LSEVVIPSGEKHRVRADTLPKSGGIYAFWWTGEREVLASERFNRRLHLHGPGGRTVALDVDDQWLGLETGLPVPLYIGKNAQSISSRVGQHLLLGTPHRVIPSKLGPQRHKPPTTSCQLRAGIEHFFPREPRPVDFILSNVGLSYVLLDGDRNAANRFYLEDLAIGLMRPPINVDIER
jgi:hypothetical protein